MDQETTSQCSVEYEYLDVYFESLRVDLYEE